MGREERDAPVSGQTSRINAGDQGVNECHGSLTCHVNHAGGVSLPMVMVQAKKTSLWS